MSIQTYERGAHRLSTNQDMMWLSKIADPQPWLHVQIDNQAAGGENVAVGVEFFLEGDEERVGTDDGLVQGNDDGLAFAAPGANVLAVDDDVAEVLGDGDFPL